MSQQAHAPVASFVAARSVVNVFQSPVDVVTQTCLPASPAAAPGAFRCQASAAKRAAVRWQPVEVKDEESKVYYFCSAVRKRKSNANPE